MRFTTTSLLAVSLVLASSFLPAGADEANEGRDSSMRDIATALDDKHWNEAERLMKEFRSEYPPDSGVKSWQEGNEVVYLFFHTLELAQHFLQEGDLEKALALYDQALLPLSDGIPHYEWRFLALRVPLQLALGRLDKVTIRKELRGAQVKFEEQSRAVENPGRKDLFDGLAAHMESALAHLDLVGEPAPTFEFVEAHNAKLTVSLAALEGKVVLIDFWATWCQPCFAAWPELKAFYAEHRSQLEILGITSLEGSHSPLSSEDERGKIEDLVAEHELPWPILLSSRPVNDPVYSITTLPSYAVIDRDGRVVGVFVGSWNGLAKHAGGGACDPVPATLGDRRHLR